MLVADMFMDEPTGNFAVIDCIDKVISAYDVSSSEDVGLAFILHCTFVNVQLSLFVFNQSLYWTLSVFGTESTDDEV